jgi:hypothetical protein
VRAHGRMTVAMEAACLGLGTSVKTKLRTEETETDIVGSLISLAPIGCCNSSNQSLLPPNKPNRSVGLNRTPRLSARVAGAMRQNRFAAHGPFSSLFLLSSLSRTHKSVAVALCVVATCPLPPPAPAPSSFIERRRRGVERRSSSPLPPSLQCRG